MKNNYKRLLAIVLLLGASLLLSGCGIAQPQKAAYEAELEVWGVFDGQEEFQGVISQYKEIHPYIKDIRYRKFSEATYRTELLEALANGTGPDIFMIQNTWLPAYKDKLQEAPAEIITPREFLDNFVDTVNQDFVSEDKIYALPLSVNSLAVFYNKDIFNTSGIAATPKTWEEFDQVVRKTTTQGNEGKFARLGAALGTAQNVNRAADILAVLMLQGGAEMVNENKTASKFNQSVPGKDGQYYLPGETALAYYTKFTDIKSPFYTWNSLQENSVDAFANGNLAMMINYPWQIEAIRAKNPKLNFGVASLPQINPISPINHANYWGFAVAKNRNQPFDPANVGQMPTDAAQYNAIRLHESWQFLKFLTMKNSGQVTLINALSKATKTVALQFDPALEYLKKVQRPAARKDILATQKNDPWLGPFAEGSFFARNWYQVNPVATEEIFNGAIEAVARGQATPHEALQGAAIAVDNLMRGKSGF